MGTLPKGRDDDKRAFFSLRAKIRGYVSEPVYHKATFVLSCVDARTEVSQDADI